MRRGDLVRAWAISDHDLATQMVPPKHTGPRHLQRIWRGEELASRDVLVRCYHGLGDTIQFLRFMPALRAVARRVAVWCQPELVPLAQQMQGVDVALPLHDGSPDITFDVDIEIMEVPHAIRATRKTVEIDRPYLKLPHTDVPPSLRRQDELSVGLVWEVGNWDKRRAIPSHLLRRFAGAGAMLYSLQRDAAVAQIEEIGANDVSTAAIIELGWLMQDLDLVVCVDTMVAHLAGALGCEAWVLLHSDCDWRWPESGSGTFWYPSLRLFRQSIPGDWDNVMDQVRAELVERAKVKRSAGREPQVDAMLRSGGGRTTAARGAATVVSLPRAAR